MQLNDSLEINPSLFDFLQSIRATGGYREHLGLLDTAQHHLKELSRILAYTAKNREKVDNDYAGNNEGSVDDSDQAQPYIPFERGVPRIVLVIDDLDRCPPEKVVTVLEAAQLLMKTDLFVVLMAIDLRYITRALEKVYDKILDHDCHPTGLDYIEKIIQMPYRVRDISHQQLAGFFSKNLDVSADNLSEETSPETDPGSQDENHTQDLTGRSLDIPPPEIKKETLQLSQDEFKNLVDSCEYLSLSPRSAKRITNVYKIWKLIWHRRGNHPKDLLEIRVMVALLAISTVRPHLVRNGLHLMINKVRLEEDRAQNLQKFFHDLARKLSEPEHVVELFIKGLLLPESFTLNQLQSSNLNLLSSFTFVGDDESSENKEVS